MADKSFWSEKKDLNWFKNFFYYYKVRVLIILFFVIAIISTIITMINNIHYDLNVCYIGNEKISLQETEKFTEHYKNYITDIDKKHGKTIYFYNITQETKPKQNEINIQGSDNQIALSQEALIQTSSYGDSFLYIFDSMNFARFNDFGIYEDISSITGNKKEPYGYCINNNKKICEILGIDDSSSTHYIAVRKVFNDKSDSEKKQQENAIKVLKQIINE